MTRALKRRILHRTGCTRKEFVRSGFGLSISVNLPLAQLEISYTGLEGAGHGLTGKRALPQQTVAESE